MWAMEVNRRTSATKEQIWNHWSDVDNWNTWDSTVEYSELYGDFREGTKGMNKPIGAPKYEFIITNCKTFESFTNRSYLPLCKVDFTVTLVETHNGLLITQRVEMTGFLSFFFSKVIGNKIGKGVYKGLEDLIESAEKHIIK